MTRPTRGRAALLAASLTALGLPFAASLPSAGASTPASSTVTAPGTVGKTATSTWTGTIPPGANPTSSCTVPGTDDQHALTLKVPSAPAGSQVDLTISITWEDGPNDEVLTVLGPDGAEVASSDGGAAQEQVSVTAAKPGTYTAVACGYTAVAPQPYTGKATALTRRTDAAAAAASAAALPLADPKGLEFTATAPSDPQRDQGEPAITVDPGGTVYACGPSGFSGVADYAQVSTDGGETFHLLGSAPRGQISTGEGGGDCALATSPVKNAQGAYTLAYAGLGPLTNFSTFTSPDTGRTLTGAPISESVPGVDRQWIAFTDAKTAFFNYNSLSLGGSVVQKSVDGGLTYDTPGKVAATDGGRLGQIRAFTPKGSTPDKAFVYYPYLAGSTVKMALSQDGGATFSQCVVAVSSADPSAGFPAADNDEDGNVYVTYAEKGGGRDTYMTAITFADFRNCKGSSADSAQNKTNPGFRKPFRLNRGGVETTVMPWLAASGQKGRVAVAFYGTNAVGDPDSGEFDATWDVYVTQTLDAFAATPAVAQVKATTHPFHYDSICLNGLGCDLSMGDRTLVDYFTMEYNKGTGKLVLVYSQTGKRPDDQEGQIATPAVVVQRGGPSNGGGTVTPGRAVVRTGSPDPTGDAISSYSRLNGLGTPPHVQPGLDLIGSSAVKVEPEVDLATGKPVKDGGFTVTLKVADLSDATLASTLASTGNASAIYLVRFVNGYRAAGVSAQYMPGQGFRFGFDDYNPTQTAGDTLLTFPGETVIKGTADQATGTLRMSVPRSLLKRLVPPAATTSAKSALALAPGQRPVEQKAVTGSRLYDVSAFTLLNPLPSLPRPEAQSYLYTVDQAPAFDYVLAGARTAAVRPRVAPARPAAASPRPSSPGSARGRLPATGASTLVPLAGLLLLGTAVVVARRRRA